MNEELPQLEEVQGLISFECDSVKELLIEKNRKYGMSAFNPIRVFSKLSTIEQIFVRIDDKLSRIKAGFSNDSTGLASEDTILDLIGYLIILRVHIKLSGITKKFDRKTQIEQPAGSERKSF